MNAKLIDLGSGAEVPANMNYRARAEILLKKAIQLGQGKRGEGYTDNKCYIESNGIESLVGAGADILCLNVRAGIAFNHEVIYKEHRFITATKKPVVYAIDPLLR